MDAGSAQLGVAGTSLTLPRLEKMVASRGCLSGFLPENTLLQSRLQDEEKSDILDNERPILREAL